MFVALSPFTAADTAASILSSPGAEVSGTSSSVSADGAVSDGGESGDS